jgi:hypothetical protein
MVTIESGGALYSASTVTILDSVFAGNSASELGGAVLFDGGFATLVNCTLTVRGKKKETISSGFDLCAQENEARLAGGAIVCGSSPGTAQLNSSTVTHNQAAFGAAILVYGTSELAPGPQLVLSGSNNISANAASGAGGGLYWTQCASPSISAVRGLFNLTVCVLTGGQTSVIAGNSAGQFGPDYASGPASLLLTVSPLPCDVGVTVVYDPAASIQVASGCSIELTLAAFDSYGQNIAQFPPDPLLLSELAVQFVTTGCVSSVPFQTITSSPQRVNVTAAGALGSSYAIQFVSVSPTLQGNRIGVHVGTCGAGSAKTDDASLCGDCVPCAPGTLH